MREPGLGEGKFYLKKVKLFTIPPEGMNGINEGY